MIFLNLEDLIGFNYYGLFEINKTAVDKFVKFFKKNNQLLVCSAYDWIDDRYWLDPSKGPEINSQYFTVGNSINFKFWEFSNNRIQHVEGTKGNLKCKGSTYMWRCLKDCYDNNDYEILNASFLAQIEIKDMINIFKTDEGKNVMTHLEERWLNWRDLGKKLLEKYNNNFYNIILKSKNDMEIFIKLSKEFRAITISITLNSNLWFLRNIIFISRVEPIFDPNKVLPKEYKNFDKGFINDEIFTLHLILYLIICIFLCLFFIFQLKSCLEVFFILIGTGLIVAAVVYYGFHMYKRYDKHRNPQKYQKIEEKKKQN